ncbi:MAG: YtxH domain-containing protein [Anaerolineales bacterium]|nr:YtxH domain-containing protein [Anaerolineales bacterium]
MMSNRDSDFGAFLTGFVLGGVLGAVIALLYAPQSGEETRAAIKEKSIEIKDKAVETAEEARLRAEHALEDARLRAEKALEETRRRAEELTQITKQRATELQKRGQVILEEQKTRLEGAIDSGKKAAKRTRDNLAGGESSTTPTKS